MNKRQKEVLEHSLKDEQAVLDALTKNYTSALADIKRNIRELQANPLTQSKAYQLEFQKQLEQQISGILDNLQGKNFKSIAEYLQTCYETGFIGTAYDWQGQGVPLVIPIDERQVLKAVEKTGDDFKLSNKRGVSTKELKKQIKEELQRGLASQLSYADIARNISDYGQADMNRSMTIARTEGHRVQSEARMDAMQAAKKKGADIVKQWDATLDGSTRPNHRLLDGQIRELDEPFEVSGMKVDHPGAFGLASEDCNCRCCVLQRARWAVEKVDPNTGEVTLGDKGEYQKWNNETGGFIQTTGYEDFRQKYLASSTALKNSQNAAKINITPVKTVTDAKDVLVKDIGFSAVEASFSKIDGDLAIANTNQLQILEQKFGCVHQSTGTICGVNDGSRTVAYVSHSLLNPTDQNLSLCPSHYSIKKDLIDSTKKAVQQGWSMPCALTDEELAIYSVTHEYGHILQNTLVRQEMILKGWTPADPRAFVDYTKKTRPARYKWYYNTEKEVQNRCFDEIIDIAKKANPNFSLSDNISDYGKSNKAEFFAEVFANSQLSKPNELGQAMNVWLKQKGLVH